MKIAVVGGAGAMSKVVIGDLVRSEAAAEILIVDRDQQEAERFAAELRARPGNRVKIWTASLNVLDHDQLVEALSGCDVALDATHQSLGAIVARGIIDARVNGCALGSGHVVAQQVLELDQVARDKGVTYLVSAGTFPGATGITARYLADQMDRVEDVHLSMAIFRPIALTPSLADLFLTFLSGEGVIYEDGVLKTTLPFSGKEEIEYCEPFGRQTVYNITSLDPLTVPLAIKGVRNVCVKATYYPDYMEMLRVFHDVGLLSRTSIILDSREVVPAEVLKELLLRRPVEPGREVVRFVQRVRVTGWKNQSRAEGIIEMPFIPSEDEIADPETRATGEPGSIVVQLLAATRNAPKGVMGPEACIDPVAFIQEWARRPGVDIRETWKETRSIRE